MAETQYDKKYFDNLSKDKKRDLESQLILSEFSPNARDKDAVSDDELAAYSNYVATNKIADQRVNVNGGVNTDEPFEKTPLSAVPLTALQGLSFGTSDEILGGIAGTGKYLFDKAKGRDVTLGDSIGTAVDDIRKPVDIMRERYPLLSLANEGAGGLITGYGISKIPQLGSNAVSRVASGRGGVSSVGRALRSVVPGVLGGATYGFASGEGGLDNRKQTALVGGLLGGGAAPLFSLGTDVLKSAIGGIANKITLPGAENKEVRGVVNPIVDRLGGADKVASEIEEGRPIILQGEGDDIGQVSKEIRPYAKGDQIAQNEIREFLGDPNSEMQKAYDDVLITLDESAKSTNYRGSHVARTVDDEGAIRLDDMTKDVDGNEGGYPDYFYTDEGRKVFAPKSQFSGDEYGVANNQSYRAIKNARGKPDAEVTIYRAVPDEDNIFVINDGDFVTLSPKYADLHRAYGYGTNTKGTKVGTKVLSKKVKVKDIIWDGNDINEFSYSPKDETFTSYADRVIDDHFNAATQAYEKQQLNTRASDEVYKAVEKIGKDKRIKLFGKKITDDIEAIANKDDLDQVFFIRDDGSLSIVGRMSIGAAEKLRRAIDQYVDVGNEVLDVKKNVELQLRGILDENYVDLKNARSIYFKSKSLSKIYKDAKKLYKDNREQDFIDYYNNAIKENVRGDLTLEQVQSAFRRAAMANIYDLVNKDDKQKVAFIKKISNSGSAAHKMLRKVYPDADFEELVNDATDADLRYKAKSKFDFGTDTQPDTSKAKYNTNLRSYIGLLKLVDQALSGERVLPEDKQRIAQIVVSKNPDVLKNIEDPKYQKYFERQIANEIIASGAAVSSDRMSDKFINN